MCNSLNIQKSSVYLCICFFFQAEDGIRDIGVTGVQTCALPIFGGLPLAVQAPAQVAVGPRVRRVEAGRLPQALDRGRSPPAPGQGDPERYMRVEIGRASCRGRV